jgi:HEAT repeat protein
VILAGDGRGLSPCSSFKRGQQATRDLAEATLIRAAAVSRIVGLRLAAIVAMGRMQDTSELTTGRNVRGGPVAGAQLQALSDRDPRVRLVAADALGTALSGIQSDLWPRPAPRPEIIATARVFLQQALKLERDNDVAAVMIETLARLPGASEEFDALESDLVTRAAMVDSPAHVLGAVRGLETLTRRHLEHAISDRTRAELRGLAGQGDAGTSRQTFLGPTTDDSVADVNARIRRLALLALQSAHDTDTPTLMRAFSDPDWQVRRLAVQMMNPTAPETADDIKSAISDPAFQVRFEALGVIAIDATSSHECRLLLKAIDDGVPQVAVHAMELLPDECRDRQAVVDRLRDLADGIRAIDADWHRPAAALEALARLAPTAAQPLLRAAAEHAAWQVRAAAAQVAVRLRDEAAITDLTIDSSANVRTAALKALGLEKPGSLSRRRQGACRG